MLKWLQVEFENQRRYEIALGVIVGLVFGFGVGWLWKEGPISSEATKLVDVFIAVGTVGAVIAAVGVALHQNWQRKKDVREDKDERALGSIMLILKALEELKLIHRRADAVFFNKHPNVTELSLTQLKGYLLSLRNLQNIPWYESPYASVYKSFHHAVFSLEDAGVTVEEWLNKMESKSFKVADLKESLSILSFAYKNAEDVYKKEIKSSDFSALPVPDRYYL